ncbi:MAG: DUF4340 domain-containing protein [Myxococcota bacterium]|nr:DUF4340 domain-containing protein [Myxococcota bacterium]
MTATGKSFAGLLAACLVAGALGLYAYYGVKKPQERQAEQKEVSDRLVAVPPAGGVDGGVPTFTSLTVEARGETTVLERRGDKWFLTSPVQAPADEHAVSQLVGQLRAGKVKARLDEQPSPEDLARYGLAPPKFSVRGTAQSGAATRPFQLQGGIENPFDGSVFVRKDQDPAVYAAPGSVRSTLEKTPFQLRDKTLWHLDPTALAAVEVKLPRNGGYSLRHPAEGWTLVLPRKGAADDETVTAMLTAFASERALAFPQEAPQGVSFQSPLLDASFNTASGAPLRVRIAADKEGRHYALREEGAASLLAEVAPSALTHLQKGYDQLRDKSVLRFDRQAAARLVFRPAGTGEEIELVREGSDAGVSDRWRVTRPVQGPATAWKVSTLLWGLSSLKARAVAAESSRNLASFGLTADSPRARVYDALGQLLAELTVGATSRADPSLSYARGGSPLIFEVEKNRLTELPTDANTLLDSSLASDAGVAASDPQ